ncbi:MAG TPA: GNAT family N-acetyltransferase [Terrimicrobiaceae bacterium]|nr:GNAT family N-acetyltransferase [Terrimicrobiaceae bacterium]
MRRAELAFAIDLAAQEGWNPGIHDAECFFAADPNGFLIGELAGEPIGCISAVSYAGRYGFIGLYIVRPGYRRRGYGLRLWQAATNRLRSHHIGLDGVPAQQSNYARSGFRYAHRSVRYRAQARADVIHDSVRPAAEVAFETISDFDRQIFPEQRDTFLRSWLAQPTAGAYVAREGNHLSGYTVIRPKIGPLAADDPIVASRLYEAALAYPPPGESIFVDVPDAHPGTNVFLAKFEATPVFETTRMYTGADPAFELSKLFGVTTFELG